MVLMRPNTKKIHTELCLVTPGGVNSPVRSFQAVDLVPLIVQKGSADQIWDVDSHSWVDFCMSWGALILGHAPANIVSVATKQIACGSSFGITNMYENQLATEIISCMPSIQKIRFVSSGTEAAMSAIRLARGYTNRNKIIKFNGHYHGHSDALLVHAGSGVLHMPTSSSLGVPNEVVSHTISLPFNDIETSRCFLQKTADIAAVIIEPIAANMGLIPAKQEFLRMLREETQKKQIVLIFDEVVTGFRIGLNGAQGHYGIEPDLTCLGKIIGGGFPAAAFGGKKEIMDCLSPLGPVYQAGTLSGNPVAMCAGLETLLTLKQPQVYSYLEELTNDFLNPIKDLIIKKNLPVTLHHLGSMFSFFFGVTQVENQEDLKNLNTGRFKDFFQYLFHRGIYLSPSAYEVNFLSLGHTQKNLEKAQEVILDYLKKS
ncbi:MAG TPA: glutamate-1-semialdehyde 2,1-aminomutase [Candidatus Rhabdochlamydia sp.]|jgi:glutamate-1-semialdehyde 2,1-aminomutase|nr:glutamate-1-semialdehyde 2,1-aminomutase [Candidatus Rhabdochlamydia sp.]